MARQAWTCSWDFGDNTPHEDGWEVFHSYELPGKWTVQIQIHDLDGKPVIQEPIQDDVTVVDDQKQSVSTRIGQPESETWPEYLRRAPMRYWRRVKPDPETRMEFVRLAFVLALALLGLMTTARQQVQNLSFLEAVGTVVALGFGADTIKNLIVRGSSSS
jgi:hypothetical protein